MLWKGHLKAGMMIGTTSAILLAPQYVDGPEIIPTVILSGASTILTSLLSDLDSENSKISKKIPIIKAIKILLILNIIFSLIFLIINKTFIEFLAINILLSVFLYKALGHRKLLHSEFIPILIYLLCIKFVGFENFITTGISIGLISGAISHLIGDSFTERGIYPFYPLKIKFRIARFKSGEDDKKINSIIFVLCLIIIFLKYIL